MAKRRRQSIMELTAFELQPDSSRIEAFSDAVFAIVVTIMMIEIHIPDGLAIGPNSAEFSAVATLLATYALSFVVIMILWASHHYLIFTIPNPNRATIWLNAFLLFCVSLIPVAAQFLGMNARSPRAAAAYGFALMACTFAFSMMRIHAAHICGSERHRAIHHHVLRKTWIAIAVYAASMPLAFVDFRIAWACFLITPMMFFLPVVRGPATHQSDASDGGRRGTDKRKTP